MTHKNLILPILSALILAGAIFAWQEPSQAPPEGNVPAPLNVGPQGQAKEGGLILNTGGAETGLIVDKGKVVINENLSLKEQGTTPAPSADYGKIYLKSDQNLYLLDEKNQEVNIGGPFTPGDYLLFSSDGGASTKSTTYTKLKEVKITKGGALRVKFKLEKTGVTVPALVYARIYRNGTPVGVERSLTGGSATYTEDISDWQRGDLVQLYAKGVFIPPYWYAEAMVSDFRIYVDNPLMGIDYSTAGGLLGWCGYNSAEDLCDYQGYVPCEAGAPAFCESYRPDKPSCLRCACPLGYQRILTGKTDSGYFQYRFTCYR